MWMMGYNDGGEFNMSDAFTGRKLRPLMPRPPPTPPANHNASPTHPCHLLPLNHHLSTVGEPNKKEFNTQPVIVSSRWNPTPEQLRTLEELYRRGTRTPSAEQIQHITAQLRRYGKIEGKNVFYWFQNHKARERQKRRRQMESAVDGQLPNIESLERKELGASRTGFEVEQSKNWTPSTNCSTLSEESVSIQRAAKAAAGAAVSEFRTDGCIQLAEGLLQQRRSLAEKNATWPAMQFLSSPPQSTHLIHNSTTTSAAIATASAAAAVGAMELNNNMLIKSQDLNIFIAPHKYRIEDHTDLGTDDKHGGHELGAGGAQTLQLFPLRSSDDRQNIAEKETSLSAMSAHLTPCQFFEFLPLKN